MVISQDRESSESSSPKDRSERPTGSRRITAGQEEFLRKLLIVLSEIVNEKGGFDDNDNSSPAPASKDIHDERRAEATNIATIPPTVPHVEVQTTTVGRAPYFPLHSCKAPYLPLHLEHFAKLYEVYDQVSLQIRISLSALGGAHRPAMALEKMQSSLREAWDSYFSFKNYEHLYPRRSIIGLDNLCDAISETIPAFKELGVSNTSFFNALDVLQSEAKEVSQRLDSVYSITGHDNSLCFIDAYLDSLFRQLGRDLDVFIGELTKVAEKEIAAIRQSQDFSGQRYFYLTTIATFLSSVTATTLQITADGSDSVLSTAANSLWVTSLVFSTASAVYSLLIVAWRRAAIRSPDLCLPRFARDWLRNGPLYSLVTALVTFSIGLCFLAFLVIDRQGSVVAAVVPVAFAGFHAYAICILSAWFLLEHWKIKHTAAWEKVRYNCVIPITATAWKMSNMIKQCSLSTYQKFMSLHGSFRTIRRHIVHFVSNLNVDDDVESGPSSAPDGMTNINMLEQIDQQESQHPAPPEASGPETWLAAPNDSVPDAFSNYHDALIESRLFNRTLQFTTDCSLLASGFSNFVTIYDVDRSFEVLVTIELSDEHPVEQVTWEPNKTSSNQKNPFKVHNQTILVRSNAGISIHHLYGENDMIRRDVLGRLEMSVEHARWVLPEDADCSGFSCLVGTSLKVFDKTCKQLRSWDLSWIPDVGDILDVTLFHGRYIPCLAEKRNDTYPRRQLFLINRNRMSLVRQYNVRDDQLSLTISSATSNVLVHGGERWQAEMGFSLPDSPDFRLRGLHADFGASVVVTGLEKTLTLCGNHDGILVGYLEGEMIVRQYNEDMSYYPKIHSMTTSDTRALVQNPVGIAVALYPSRSFPYLFAFGAADGTVKIWSVLSNDVLWNESAETFEIHDEQEYWSSMSTGRFLVLPPPGSFQQEPVFIQEEDGH